MSALMSEFQEIPAILGLVPVWADESIYKFYLKPDRFLFLFCLQKLIEDHAYRKGPGGGHYHRCTRGPLF